MKTLLAICCLCLACLTAQAATTTISGLPVITAPSTNTYFEVADMSATPKSRKLAILSLKGSIVTNITEAMLSLSDVTTLNASTSMHGFLPKLTGNTNNYVSGNGTEQAMPNNTTNTVFQTNSVTVLKGGHVTVTNNITILTNGTFTLQNLPLPSVLIVGTNGNVTNATLSGLTLGNDGTLTATGGGGASTWIPVTTLAFSTTNVTIPLNGGTNFVVTLTNGSTGYFTSSGAPASASTNTTFTLTVIQDATGTRAMNWDTNVFKFMGGVVPVCTTNASAEDVFTITSSGKTAGKMNVVWNPDFK
jgi:hypothetical protein